MVATILTCQCTRAVTPGGESVLICQVPPTPSNLTPGQYAFTCQSHDDTLSGHQLLFEWTGSEWKRQRSTEGSSNKNKVSSDTSSNNKKGATGGWNSGLQSWLDKPFIVTKSGSRPSIFSSRPMTAQLVVSKRGFVPRENLKFEMTVKNSPSQSKIERMRVSLVQKIKYFTLAEGRKTVVTNLVERQCTNFDDNSKNNNKNNKNNGLCCWTEEFEVPDFLMPSLSNERNVPGSVEVAYFLEFVVETSGGKSGLRGKAPIVIGKRRTRTAKKEENGDRDRDLSMQAQVPPCSMAGINFYSIAAESQNGTTHRR